MRRALELLDRALQMSRTIRSRPRWPPGRMSSASSIISPPRPRRSAREASNSCTRRRTLCSDATVLAILGNALSLLNEFDAADLVTRKALTIDGGSAWAWSRSGWIDVYKGDPQSAIERFKIALDLAPHDPLAFNSMVGIGCALFTAGQYRRRRALAGAGAGRASLRKSGCIGRCVRPMCWRVRRGRPSRSLVALRQHYPDLTVPEVQRGMPPLPPSQCDLVVGALQEAGLPG